MDFELSALNSESLNLEGRRRRRRLSYMAVVWGLRFYIERKRQIPTRRMPKLEKLIGIGSASTFEATLVSPDFR